MGAIWRSELMDLVQIFIQIESARETVFELGKLGLVQFRDLNPEVNLFSRHFVNEVRRFDEMERQLRYFHAQVKKVKKDLPPFLGQYIEPVRSDVPGRVLIDELEAKFEELEKELVQMSANQETLDKNYTELVELLHVLEKAGAFFNQSSVPRLAERSESSPLNTLEAQSATNLGFIAGVIPRDKIVLFERILWRATRGNVYFKTTEIAEKIKDPAKGNEVHKNVFVVFFQGERAKTKVKKLAESFNATVYPCPETAPQRIDLKDQVQKRLDDLRLILSRTKEHSIRILSKVAANLEYWKEQIVSEKAIYHAMNLFNYDVGRKCLIAEAWVPSDDLDQVRDALRRASERSGAMVPSILSVIATHDSPPTHFKTTPFTQGFQDIVDAYGVARYREVNPAVFTIITFPFLFAVMFGDFGHGVIMTLVAGLLVLYEKRLSEAGLTEMARTMFDGRYVIFLMGLFSMYVGMIYNETFAVPINIFGSKWHFAEGSHHAEWDYSHSAYPFGVDPTWKNAGNDLVFYNSLKMKLSIILGVTQMVLGIIMSYMNFTHFKKSLEIKYEFIPQMIFMNGIFGYMVFLIFFKWATNFKDSPPATLQGSGAPSILNLMIQMFLSPKIGNFNPAYHLFTGQPLLQFLLLIAALISVPVMLFVKPYILKKRHENSGNLLRDEHEEHHGEHGEHGEGFEFSEVIVHQCIHTIEFVLGAVSNTASYLRLWALSLAHAELSKVFWEMVLLTGLSYSDLGGSQFIMIFVCFAIWTSLTVAVLLLMESLSAFLHALRLHWVEFQNKFYGGDGYAFQPFSFKVILEGAVLETPAEQQEQEDE